MKQYWRTHLTQTHEILALNPSDIGETLEGNFCLLQFYGPRKKVEIR